MKYLVLLCMVMFVWNCCSYEFYCKDFITEHVLTPRLKLFLEQNKRVFQQTLGPIYPSCMVKFAQHLWKKECGARHDHLTFWSTKEEFPALGIAHFTWFPKNIKNRKPFVENFPSFLDFIVSYNENIDSIVVLDKERSCPWNSRHEFYAQFYGHSLLELRNFLIRTMDLQVCFILKTFHDRLSAQMNTLSKDTVIHAKKQIKRLVQSPGGLFVLMDYASFKGLDDAIEKYKGQGWGLFSVLEHMHGVHNGRVAIVEFVNAAMKVLKIRVENAPAVRHEERFLAGWNNRLKSYLLP